MSPESVYKTDDLAVAAYLVGVCGFKLVGAETDSKGHGIFCFHEVEQCRIYAIAYQNSESAKHDAAKRSLKKLLICQG